MSRHLSSSKSVYTSYTKAQEESQPGKQVGTPGSVTLRQLHASLRFNLAAEHFGICFFPFLYCRSASGFAMYSLSFLLTLCVFAGSILVILASCDLLHCSTNETLC